MNISFNKKKKEKHLLQYIKEMCKKKKKKL